MARFVSLDSFELDGLDVRERFAVLGPVGGLPAHGVGVQAGEDVGRGQLLAVGPHTGRLDYPLLAVLAPCALAEAAGRFERPRADVLAERVPADPLRAAADGEVLEGGRERGQQEILAFGPCERDAGRLTLVGCRLPVAGKPVQLAQMFVIARGRIGSIPNAAQEPLAVFLDVNDAVAGPTGRTTVRRQDGRGPVLNGHVRRHEAQGSDVDAELEALVLREQLLEDFLDGLASLQLATGLVHVIAVGGPERCQGLGVALVEGLDEGLGLLQQGFLILALRLFFPGLQGTAGQAGQQADGKDIHAALGHDAFLPWC